MRIALVSCLYHPHHVGGAERTAQRIADGLVARGDEVLVITLDPSAAVRTEVINGVTVERIRIPNLYWPFPQKKRLPLVKLGWHAIDQCNLVAERTVARVLRRFKPDIVQTHNLAGFSTAVWSAIARMGLPIVHILHDYYLLCVNSTMVHGDVCHHGRHGLCRYVRALQRRQSRHVGTVVGVSQFVLNTHLRSGIFPNASTRVVINNGYDAPPERQAIIRERGAAAAPVGPLRVGYLGQVVPIKGLRPLLSAVGKLPPDRLTVSIAGMGDEAFVQELKQRYPLPNVRFAGRVNAGEFLNEIDVLCVPSIWHDPLPTVVFEAYAHGAPVVGSRMGGITEMIADGVTGRLVPPDDADALAAALAELIASPAKVAALGRNALQRSQEFTIARNIAAYATLHSGLSVARFSAGRDDPSVRARASFASRTAA